MQIRNTLQSYREAIIDPPRCKSIRSPHYFFLSILIQFFRTISLDISDNHMAQKTILILGGGVGGIVTANELRRHLGRDHRIIIVDKNRIQTLGLSFLWIMVGWRKAYAIERDLSLLEKKGIEFLHAAVTGIDIPRRKVETEKGTLSYDYLVIALGAEYDWDALPGVNRTANTFYTLSGSEDVYHRLAKFEGGRISFVVCSMPYKCPPAPFEAALLADSYLKRRGLRDRTEIEIVIPEDVPLPVAGPDVGKAMRALLDSREILLTTGHKITSYDPTKSTLHFENDRVLTTDFAIFVPPHRSPAVVRDAALVNQTGWIPVDRRSLVTTDEHVYALGDVTTIGVTGGMTLPKAAVFAISEAEVVAYNIAQHLTDGKLTRLWHWGKERVFSGSGYCFVEVGDGKAGYLTGEFFADPAPKVTFHDPSSAYHWGKVVFEKYWLWRWF